MAEIGYQLSALPGWQSFTNDDEPNPDLIWPGSVRVYDKMRREDGQVSSVLRAVTMPIRSAKWEIIPGSARPDVVAMVSQDLGLQVLGQEDTASSRTDGRFSWREHLRLALLELTYGHSFFEQVYELGADGRDHLAKLAWRPPRSISEIDVDSDGGLVAIKQYPLMGSVTIPVDRLVAYVNDREGGDWIGQSLLRPAYKNWLLKDRLLRAQALTIERNGLGVPVYTGAEAPESVNGVEAIDKWNKDEHDAGLKIASGFRAGATAGASIPAGSKLELLGVNGKLPDTDAPIRYHDEQIARSVLAHFLNLGTETGSWALGSTFADFFTQSLNAVARQVQDVTQQHVIGDLVALNWGPDEPVPMLRVEEIGDRQTATATAIQSLVQSGAITPDQPLEDFMRAQYGIPPRDPNAEPKTVPAQGAQEDTNGQAG